MFVVASLTLTTDCSDKSTLTTPVLSVAVTWKCTLTMPLPASITVLLSCTAGGVLSMKSARTCGPMVRIGVGVVAGPRMAFKAPSEMKLTAGSGAGRRSSRIPIRSSAGT